MTLEQILIQIQRANVREAVLRTMVVHFATLARLAR